MTDSIGQEFESMDRKREFLLTMLNDIQHRNGYLSKEDLDKLAQSVGLTLSEVYSVSSFYSFLNHQPAGKHIIRICQSLPCYMKNSQSIIDAIESQLGISPGQTSTNGLFSLQLVNCIGACDVAPAMLVDDNLHGHLNEEEIARVLDTYK